jgi:formylglycine-generating enzyme required for sulfatase activity
VRAGFLLGDLGDPRFPVALDDWRRELDRRDEQFGAPQGYWCCIRPGAYRIGGWEEREPAADITLPAFWIARLPITVAQFAPFVELGYRPDAQCWWTPNGWRWKGERTEPWLWDDPSYSGANQPVTGVTWYEAAAFCAWLADQLADRLREGYVVRLPTEAEWEATAAYDAAMHRCSYPWGEEESTSERAIYDASQLNAPAPVGCCPAGVAACGALDLAGNVWEWATTAYKGYPKQSDEEVKDFTGRGVDVPLRGGAYYSEGTSVRCGARIRYPPVIVDTGGGGFRVVLAPRSH